MSLFETPPPEGALPPASESAANAGKIRIPIAPIPCGVLLSQVVKAEAHSTRQHTYILDFQCMVEPFQNSAPVQVWFNCLKPDEMTRFTSCLSALGLPVQVSDGFIDIPAMASIKGSQCNAVWAPWHSDNGIKAQIAKFPPREDLQSKYHNLQFDAWMKQAGMSYDALKGCQGFLSI